MEHHVQALHWGSLNMSGVLKIMNEDDLSVRQLTL